MITLNDISRLTNIREEGLKALIASGALPVAHWGEEAGNEVGLTLPALARLQDLKVRCIREAAKAFGLSTGEMFRLVKTQGCIFDAEAGRVIIDPESEAYLIQELLKARKTGGVS